MIIKILLIFLGLLILLLPLVSTIIKGKKLTKTGIIFIIIAVIFTILQIKNEHRSSKNEAVLEKDKNGAKIQIDSLIIKTLNLSDSIQILKRILTSIDDQFYETNKKVAYLGKINYGLNKKLIESDRPLLVINKTKINRSSLKEGKSSIDFDFDNFW